AAPAPRLRARSLHDALPISRRREAVPASLEREVVVSAHHRAAIDAARLVLGCAERRVQLQVAQGGLQRPPVWHRSAPHEHDPLGRARHERQRDGEQGAVHAVWFGGDRQRALQRQVLHVDARVVDVHELHGRLGGGDQRVELVLDAQRVLVGGQDAGEVERLGLTHAVEDAVPIGAAVAPDEAGARLAADVKLRGLDAGGQAVPGAVPVLELPRHQRPPLPSYGSATVVSVVVMRGMLPSSPTVTETRALATIWLSPDGRLTTRRGGTAMPAYSSVWLGQV